MSEDYMKYDGRNPEPPYETECQEERRHRTEIIADLVQCRKILYDLVLASENLLAVREGKGGTKPNADDTTRQAIEVAKIVLDMSHVTTIMDSYRNQTGDEMSQILHTFTNYDDGIESRVAQIDAGYSVTIRDMDADEVVGTAIIYKEVERAIAKAKEII